VTHAAHDAPRSPGDSGQAQLERWHDAARHVKPGRHGGRGSLVEGAGVTNGCLFISSVS
jgi:hypothetical protein